MPTLVLVLVRGEDLPSADANGLSDPYVSLHTDQGHSFKSRTVPKTLNPHWEEDAFRRWHAKYSGTGFKHHVPHNDQEAVWEIKPGHKELVISCKVWDADLVTSDFLGLGELRVPVTDEGIPPTEVQIPLRPSKPGGRGQGFIVARIWFTNNFKSREPLEEE